MKKLLLKSLKDNPQSQEQNHILTLTAASFKQISVFWPLKNLIAVNPLQGLEDLPIEAALCQAAAYFEQKELPTAMEAINRITIKWLQAYFDNGQATIPMPFKNERFYSAWRKLAPYDTTLHLNDKLKQTWLKQLPDTAEQAIALCLKKLSIHVEDYEQFTTLMLTTLPGWAAYIKYLATCKDAEHDYPITIYQEDYLALRLVLTSLLWPQAQNLIAWHKQALAKSVNQTLVLKQIEQAEQAYRMSLLKQIGLQKINPAHTPKAQFLFCIDVRSEPLRKQLEAIDDYQTFGCAGFFGIPVKITNAVTQESYNSCPVLLSPQHEVSEAPASPQLCKQDLQGYLLLTGLKRLYQSIKYTFAVPFALVESLGLINGLWMALRSLSPFMAYKIKTSLMASLRQPQEVEPVLDNLSFSEQYLYAEQALKIIGFTQNFAPVVVFCGHGSTTQNNAYASALDCGACGGRHGGSNARIIAAILNKPTIKAALSKNNIHIPANTIFIAAEHNTTTDEITLYGQHDVMHINKLKADLAKVKNAASSIRLKNLYKKANLANSAWHAWLRSQDWAQVRPEWGLARNAAFIVAPRDLTRSLTLEGRCFLHSYDYTQDSDHKWLTAILTAPMVVAQWINTQYLFSSLNNIAYGSGSKITKNITGKIGIMQGNGSDLMTGLPLQSVYSSDLQAYHEPCRLLSVVFAPRKTLTKIINAQLILQKLFGNGWVQLASIEPEDQKVYLLNRDFTWKKID